MQILSVDTSSTSCSVAVCREDVLLAEVTNDIKETHAKHLMGMIDNAIRLSGLDLSLLDGFAVTQGPGSFTGLRIGIATVKGLAAATGKPIAGVSALDALAAQGSGFNGLICALMDARRGEVYAAVYRRTAEGLTKLSEEAAMAPDAVFGSLGEPAYFIGQGAVVYRDAIRKAMGDASRFAPPALNTIRASVLSQLSLPRFKSGRTDDTSGFMPVYLRKSDAEINLRKD